MAKMTNVQIWTREGKKNLSRRDVREGQVVRLVGNVGKCIISIKAMKENGKFLNLNGEVIMS